MAMAEHYCIEVVAELDCIVVVEHCCTEVVVEIEKGPHLPKVLEPQESPVGLGAMRVEKTFRHPEQGENRCSS